MTTKEARQAFAGAQNDLCGGDDDGSPPALGTGSQIEQVGFSNRVVVVVLLLFWW